MYKNPKNTFKSCIVKQSADMVKMPKIEILVEKGKVIKFQNVPEFFFGGEAFESRAGKLALPLGLNTVIGCFPMIVMGGLNVKKGKKYFGGNSG